MPEKLHYEDYHKAGVLRWQHELADTALISAKNNHESVVRENQALIKSGDLLTESDAVKESVAVDRLHNAENAYDANLWRAQQHKNEHLPEYIESARQDAEAQGVHIDLGQPKE